MINGSIFLLQVVVILVGFSLMVMIPLCKNPVWWIHDYPEDIQEKYFETHERVPARLVSKPVLIKKGVALLAFAVVFIAMAFWAGARDFWSGFLCSYGIFVIVNVYDCVFLDWVLFANMKAVRLPGTEHMDKEYHQKLFHVKRGMIGMGLGLLPSIVTGLIIMLLCGGNDAAFNGSKVGNENEFRMEYSILNTTYEHSMELFSGDIVECSIQNEKGDLDVCVQKQDGEYVYRGSSLPTSSFLIIIEEAGTYTISITGERARGSVAFVRE